MSIADDRWFEIWYVPGVDVIPSYLVVVTPNTKHAGEILVTDISKNEVIYSGKNYEIVYNWLIEDEFCLVDGRIFTDDGWS